MLLRKSMWLAGCCEGKCSGKAQSFWRKDSVKLMAIKENDVSNLRVVKESVKSEWLLSKKKSCVKLSVVKDGFSQAEYSEESFWRKEGYQEKWCVKLGDFKERVQSDWLLSKNKAVANWVLSRMGSVKLNTVKECAVSNWVLSTKGYCQAECCQGKSCFKLIAIKERVK